ncbi:MAG: GNAT family N-acetyltransferase [Alphaproteobacteria bacterium]
MDKTSRYAEFKGKDGKSYRFRPAGRDDARRIAELYRAATDGVADYIWGGLATAGESVLDVGERRFARSGEDFSWQNCILAGREGAVVGLCHRYLAAQASGPPPDDFDPVLRPFAELEDPGSLYVAGISIDPAHRRTGLARELLRLAFGHARDCALPRVSALIFDSNAASRALFEGVGCRVIDQREVPPHPIIERSGEILLYSGPAQGG